MYASKAGHCSMTLETVCSLEKPPCLGRPMQSVWPCVSKVIKGFIFC